MKRKDEEIKMDVIDQLYWNDRVDTANITVASSNGVVTLNGKVPDYAAIRSALSDVSSVPGVTRVENRLSVISSDDAIPPDDSIIKHNIERALQLDDNIDAGRIEVTVDTARVTIEGQVDTYWEKVWAEEKAATVPGVIDIANRLTVVSDNNIVDSEIAEKITAAIDRSGTVSIDTIDIEVTNGIVTITGTVPDYDSREEINRAAIYTDGVVDVNNRVIIQ